jgi:hypothetical protein
VIVPGLTNLQAAAVEVIPGKPVTIFAAYLSPSRQLIGADLTAYYGGGLPDLMTGTSTKITWIGTLG